MPPQDPQSPRPQQPSQPPTPPIQPQSVPLPGQNTELLGKKIRNAGQSVLLLGCLMTLLSAISLLGVKSLPADQRTVSYIYLVVVALVSIYWIITGAKIKSATNNASTALTAIQTVMISAFVLVGLTIIAKFAVSGSGGGLAGILALVLALYLLVAKSRIKKLNSQ